MEIQDGLDLIKALQYKQAKLAEKVLAAYDGAFYAMDLLTIGTVNRSVQHCSGFRTMIANRNLLCAGVLLRLQIDTIARFSAAWLVEDPHDFALKILAGKQVRRLCDQDGNKMTDRYLVKKLLPEAEWIERVYEKTSGYVHLSSTHLMAAISEVNAEDSTFSLKISEVDKPLPQELYIEAIEAFLAATTLLGKYVFGWGFTKEHPEITRRGAQDRPPGDA